MAPETKGTVRVTARENSVRLKEDPLNARTTSTQRMSVLGGTVGAGPKAIGAGLSLSPLPTDWGAILASQACSPLWSHECGSSYYTTGMCSRVNSNFRFSKTVAPALQSKWLQICRLGLSDQQSMGGSEL